MKETEAHEIDQQVRSKTVEYAQIAIRSVVIKFTDGTYLDIDLDKENQQLVTTLSKNEEGKTAKNLFGWFKSKKKETVQPPSDPLNPNYVCIPTDPIHTLSDLLEGDWNMDKVQQMVAMGLLRYAKESEIAEARAIGRIK